MLAKTTRSGRSVSFLLFLFSLSAFFRTFMPSLLNIQTSFPGEDRDFNKSNEGKLFR